MEQPVELAVRIAEPSYFQEVPFQCSISVLFATKPELARQMIEQAVTAGVPFGWFAADEKLLAAWRKPGTRQTTTTAASCRTRWHLSVIRN